MAPSAPSKSLDGCVVAFLGKHTIFPEFKNKTTDDMRDLVGIHGGNLSTKITLDCTHFIANDTQYNGKGVRVSEAKKLTAMVVNYEWLSKSVSSQTKIDEASYLIAGGPTKGATNGSNNASRATSPATRGNKRRASAVVDANDHGVQSDGQVDQAPASKKTRTSKGAKAVHAAEVLESKDEEKEKSVSLNVPVDEHCPLAGRSRVYIDDDGTIFDATLNQTNSGYNNNKFYLIQLLVDDKGRAFTWTRWGRVGERGQNSLLGDGGFATASREFEKKFKDKNGNKWAHRDQPAKDGKYIFIERNYEDSSDDEDELPGAGKRRSSKESVATTTSHTPIVESQLSEPIQHLMKLIFNQKYFNDTMASLDYDANKMPLGKLSKRTLLQGYEVLKDLATLVNGLSAPPGSIEERSNRYFSLIPHSFGRNRPPVLSSSAMIKREIDLLETLTDMQLANDIMKDAKKNAQENINIMDRQFQGLGLKEMTPLETSSNEFTQIQDYLVRSAGSTHNLNYKVQDIFRIERVGEFDRFGTAYSNLKNSDRRLLWHGSRCTNFGGILSQGLRIAPPEAPVSGYMFGKGVYLADMSTKSANYCASYMSGNIGLLLLCEAELGKPPLKLTNADSNAGDRAKAASCISTWGVGATSPQEWKDAGCVHKSLNGVLMPDLSTPPGPSAEANAYLMYNEYIAYDVAQIRLRYLLRVEMR